MMEQLFTKGSAAVPSIVEIAEEIKQLKTKIAEQDDKINDLIAQLSGVSLEDRKDAQDHVEDSSTATHAHFYTSDFLANLPRPLDAETRGMIILVVGNKTSNKDEFSLALQQHFLNTYVTRKPTDVIVRNPGTIEIPEDSKDKTTFRPKICAQAIDNILNAQHEGKIVICQVESIYDTRPELRKNVDVICFHYPDLENQVYLANWENWITRKGVRDNHNQSWNDYLLAHDEYLRSVKEWFNVRLVFPQGPIADKIKPHSYLCWNATTEQTVYI